MGPWSLGYHTFGVEPFLLMSLDDPARDEALPRPLKEVTIVFGQAQIEAGADALTLPDHATGDLVSAEYYRRYLRDMHIEFAEELRRADHPAHLRAHRRPHGVHRRDRHGGLPLRLQERAGGVDGRRRRAHQPRRQRQQPRARSTRRAPPRCARRCARTSRPASRWSARSARSRCRRRSRTCSRSATRWTEWHGGGHGRAQRHRQRLPPRGDRRVHRAPGRARAAHRAVRPHARRPAAHRRGADRRRRRHGRRS